MATAPAAPEYERFSDAEYERRFAAVRQLLDDRGLDALLVYGGSGAVGPVHYLSNFLPWRPTWLLFPARGDSALLLNFRNHVPCTRAMSIVADVSCFWPSAAGAVAGKIRERGLDRARIGLSALATVPYKSYVELTGLLPQVSFEDVGRPYNEIRWVRSEEELDRLRRAAALADRACELLADQIRPGRTEHELQMVIHEAFVAEGGHLGLAFLSSTSMSEPGRGVPWQFMTGRTLAPGDVVITELTVSYWGYSGQIHRPFAVAADPTPLYRRLYDAAAECYEAVRTSLVPGATSDDVIAAGEVVRRRGFRLFDSLLHGEGGRNPELGSAGSEHSYEPWTFRENQIMVIQPNPVTDEHEAGLQLGAATRVAPGGAESIHRFPFVFPVCG